MFSVYSPAVDQNLEFNIAQKAIRFKCNYDYLKIGQYLQDKRLEIESLGTHEDEDEILKSLNNYINDAHSQRNVRKDKCKRIRSVNLMQHGFPELQCND